MTSYVSKWLPVVDENTQQLYAEFAGEKFYDKNIFLKWIENIYLEETIFDKELFINDTLKVLGLAPEDYREQITYIYNNFNINNIDANSLIELLMHKFPNLEKNTKNNTKTSYISNSEPVSVNKHNKTKTKTKTITKTITKTKAIYNYMIEPSVFYQKLGSYEFNIIRVIPEINILNY